MKLGCFCYFNDYAFDAMNYRGEGVFIYSNSRRWSRGRNFWQGIERTHKELCTFRFGIRGCGIPFHVQNVLYVLISHSILCAKCSLFIGTRLLANGTYWRAINFLNYSPGLASYISAEKLEKKIKFTCF